MNRNDKLKVLHIGKFYPPYLGGMETHLQSLCTELKNFVNLKVVVANDSRESLREVVGGVDISRMGTLFTFAAAPVCPGLLQEIRESEADIIHLHLPNPIAILAYLASGHKGKLVITYHSDIIRQKVLGALFEPMLHKALKRCSAIIATSPNYIESSSVLSMYKDRCDVIPHGIELDRFYEYDKAGVDKIREKHGSRIVISVGRLIYYKGFEYLVQAMENIDGRLLIIGDGPLRESLIQQAKDRGISDRVVFLGEIANISPYYQAADVFALASVARSEAFGIVQIEAMACGKPVVNTNLDSGVPFVSLHGETGLTVPPQDADALASAINLLLDKDDLRAQYGKAARRRTEQEFSLDCMVSRTLQLYEKVMSAPLQMHTAVTATNSAA
ncbi:MAG TPA: glycosyltransferase [Blastocatellia bacterium]|nr:glycosyltransferase [Blastocatellia bacterium]